jgi:hypothetical protein
MYSIDDVSYHIETPFSKVMDWEVFNTPVWAKYFKILMKINANSTSTAPI